MKYLDRNAILGTGLRVMEEEVEAWGGTIRLREPSGKLSRFLTDLPEGAVRSATWIVHCAIDEDGERIFENDDIALMAEKSGILANALVNKLIDEFGLQEKKAPSPVESVQTSDSPKS